MTNHPLDYSHPDYNHPLSNKIIREELTTREESDRRLDYGRANYYEEDFRTAADWQLEQVMRWLDENLDDYTTDTDPGFFYPMRKLPYDLNQAMRPTQEDQAQEDQEDQEDLKLVMERKRRNGPTTRLTLEELSMRSTQEES